MGEVKMAKSYLSNTTKSVVTAEVDKIKKRCNNYCGVINSRIVNMENKLILLRNSYMHVLQKNRMMQKELDMLNGALRGLTYQLRASIIEESPSSPSMQNIREHHIWNTDLEARLATIS